VSLSAFLLLLSFAGFGAAHVVEVAHRRPRAVSILCSNIYIQTGYKQILALHLINVRSKKAVRLHKPDSLQSNEN
jgi:hypothetical protein